MADKERKEAPARKSKHPKGATMTIYTHGKKFVVSADTDLALWLKEKYPLESK